MPSQNDGSRSPKERSLGLKAKNVASLNKVKMSKKIKKRFTTHRMVLGIFSLISIMLRPVEAVLPVLKKDYKRRHFHRFHNDFMLIFSLEITRWSIARVAKLVFGGFLHL